MGKEQVRVLLVEDDQDDYLLTQDLLNDVPERPYVLEWARTFEDGLEKASREEYQAILVDYRLGGRTGLELLKELKARGASAPVIFLTGLSEREVDQAALDAGASDYIVKMHLSADVLDRSIRYSIERERLREAQEQLRRWDLETGARIQSAMLLPKPPEMQGLEIGTHSVPSQTVDGDFWDFLVFDRHRLDVCIGDVMGKGVQAALLSAGLKARLQDCTRRLVLAYQSIGRLPDPEEILSALHHDVTDELERLGSFVTLSCMRFDTASMQALFVDAGHVRTIRRDGSTGEVQPLSGTNLPLGVSRSEVYTQQRVPMQCGDVFVFYSDGLTDVRGEGGEFYGEERVMEAVRVAGELDAWEFARRLCADAESFARSDGIRDDLTCVVVRVRRERAPKPVYASAMEVRSDPADLEAMRKFIEWSCKRQAKPPLTDYECSTLVLAVGEAASNILRHAYWGERHRPVQVTVETYEGFVQVDLADWGPPFDVTTVPEPSFDGSRSGGFGVFIIQNTVDEYRYYRDELGRNHLLLIRKSLGREKSEE